MAHLSSGLDFELIPSSDAQMAEVDALLSEM
jgi:hypothetical protein